MGLARMTRGAGATLLAEFAKASFHPVVLVHIDWPGEAVRAHTGRGQITWNGADWSGVWRFASMSLPPESSGAAAGVATVQIVGDPQMVYAQLDTWQRNRAATIWFGAVSERASNVLVGQPVQVFTGYMDAARCPIVETEDGFTHVLEVDLVSGPPARAMGSYYHCDADQRRRFPADTAGRLLVSNAARQRTQQWPEN